MIVILPSGKTAPLHEQAEARGFELGLSKIERDAFTLGAAWAAQKHLQEMRDVKHLAWLFAVVVAFFVGWFWGWS